MAEKTKKEKVRSGQDRPGQRPGLQAEKRKIVGRKARQLRQQGILPGNIYGKKVKSLAVKVDLKSFSPVFKKVGETGLVELTVKGETKARPVLIHNVQFHPTTDQPLHVDFYQVDLKTKVTTEIPVELIGESLAVKEKSGVLIQPLIEVEVEALPADFPESFKVDLGRLEEIGDTIKVESLKAPKGVEILTPAGQILARVEPPTKEEEAPPPKEEAPPEEVPEGEEPAEKAPPEPVEGRRPEPVEGKPAKKVEKEDRDK